MAILATDTKDLFTYRIQHVKSLLSPLAEKKRFHCEFYRPKVARGKVLVAHDGKKIQESYREWSFRSHARDIWCRYFELWIPITSEGEWYLNRAYLTILRTNYQTRSLEEYLCIHCDPNDTSDEPGSSHKRGPHLHVEMAEPPIPDCHFPLNLGHLEQVLSSVDSLTEALQQTIEVLSHEFLARC